MGRRRRGGTLSHDLLQSHRSAGAVRGARRQLVRGHQGGLGGDRRQQHPLQDIHNDEVRGRDIAKDTVRGTDVRDNDIQGRDIRDHTISGADVKESSLAKVPLAGDADTLGGKSAAAFLASDRLVRVGPVALHEGEDRTVATSGPFTWRASCSDTDQGTHLSVKLESTEANSFAGSFGDGGGPVSPGSPTTMFDGSSSTPGYQIAFPLSASAPSGAAPVGLAFVGINVGTTDCLVNGMMLP